MKRLALAGLVAAATLCSSGGARSDTSPEAAPADARRDRVVATLGAAPTARTITVGELEDRIAALPSFQRATFGNTPDIVRRAYLMQVLIPEALFSLGAEARKLADQPRTAHEIDRALSGATIRAVRERLGPATAIPTQDVQKYYDENHARYDSPERYQIWRILCKTRDEAASVLEEAKKDPTPKTFGQLARDHSIDKASNLRDGNLGFLTADGASNEPGLRVAPGIIRAAQTVRDGEFVPAPVPEGDSFAVVWRRGTVAANHRTLDDVAAQIRDTLWKARVKKETDALLESVRAAKLRDYDPSLVESIDIPVDADAGGMALRRRNGVPPAAAPSK